ncbi:MAG: sulfate adenylyltransferase [Firmicutes bacterium]|nr:sulfate adenylyltransferase [Bacillota bacterium]
MIKPHGGRLVNKKISGAEREEILEGLKEMPLLRLSRRDLMELENIGVGLYSPLEGFMNEDEYNGVVEEMRLSNGTVWPLPIVLGVSKNKADELKIGSKIALANQAGKVYGILKLEDKFIPDKEKEAQYVYRTRDRNHPGVAVLNRRGEFLLGGELILVNRLTDLPFASYRHDPIDVRREFRRRGWKQVAAFQTRNPIHRAHEYLQKCALEITDGLFLSPLVGETKSTDIPAKYRIKSYEVVIDKIYPSSRVYLTVFPVAMRYAGPREAVFHALCRKNYGCSHFIVGRDHAGVGNYYGTYDAQLIFDEFAEEEIGITPLKFEYSFYCTKCQGMATAKTCPHDKSYQISLSGTRVRELLRQGERPPVEITRHEVVDVLIEAMVQQEEN